MKNIQLFLFTFCLSLSAFAQQGISYKAVVKDGGGNIVANQNITVQFQILQGVGMLNVYQETHSPTTDANGIVIVIIGEGSIDSGVYSDIEWGTDEHHLNVQINTGGGLTDIGTTQFMAVPYALSAANAASKIDELSDGKSDNDGTNDGSSIFLGVNAGLNDDASNNLNVGIGFQALSNNTTGVGNTANGNQALMSNIDGYNNTANGLQTLSDNTSGNNNTANGSQALLNNIDGFGNTANGSQALSNNTTGNFNTAIGYRAGRNNITGNSNVFIGSLSGLNETNSNKLYIENSNANADNALIYGEFDNNILRTNSVFQIGNPTGTGFAFPSIDGTANQVLQTNGSGALIWVNSTSLGSQKINDLTDGKSDNDGSSLFLGVDAGLNDDGSNLNVGVGYNALFSNTSGVANTAVGRRTLYLNTEGTLNTAMGVSSLQNNITGNNNTAIGSNSLVSNLYGHSNTANGALALNSNIAGGSNSAFGTEALYNNLEDNNVANGYRAGYSNINGDGNIFIGFQSGYNETGSNKLYIENTNASADNALIYGEFDNDILRTNGTFQIGNPSSTGFAFPTADGTANQVLQTNGSGSLSWVNESLSSGLESLDEGNGIGWRLIGRNPSNYGDIGLKAVDLSSDIGLSTTQGATGDYSIGMGYGTFATGNYSTSMGYITTASGIYSTSMGYNTIASGNYATAIGIGTKAESYNGLAVGQYNVGGGNPTTWSSADKMFEVGIGMSNGSRANALTILKNGNVGIGTVLPGQKFEVYQASGNLVGVIESANGDADLHIKGAGASNPGVAFYDNGAYGGSIGYSNTNDYLFIYEGGNFVFKNGDFGVGTTTPAVKLQVDGGSDASLSDGSGFIVIGSESATNIVMDTNEIIARNNGATSNLHFQTNGGDVYVGGALIHSSDRRLKQDIERLGYGLDEILQLRPVSYHWKSNPTATKKSLGLIAQEVHPILKELVTINAKRDNTLGVNYNELIPVLINAIQEQHEIIEDQQNEIIAIKSEFDTRLARLEAAIKTDQN
jgi:hypothetical protein